MKNINRSPDEAAGGMVDPLNEAAGTIDTSFPVLAPDRIVEFKVESSKIAASKSNEQNQTLTIKFKSTKPAKLLDGKETAPGFPVFKRYGITPTEPTVDDKGNEKAGRTIENIKKDLATVLKACFGPKTDKTPRQLIDNPSMLEGEIVQGKTSVDKGSGNFGPSTNISFVLPA